jgi:selenide,water dikinase
VPDWASGLELANRRVVRAQGPALAYDLVSLDIGSAPTHPLQRGEVPGIPVKPVDRFLAGWDKILADARARPLEIVTVGGGAGGVEITLAMHYRLRRAMPGASCRFTLVTDSKTILPGHSDGVRRRFERMLAARGIEVRAGSHVVGYDGDLLLENDQRMPADQLIWATGPQPPEWLAASGLHTDTAGFMRIDDCMRAVANPDVFAAGDMATMVNHPRPKSGVFAVRQGPYLTHNLRQALAGGPLRPYLPQSEALALISTGDKYAIASRGRWSLEGAWVWRWKDWIDRRFMRRYSELHPSLPATEGRG